MRPGTRIATRHEVRPYVAMLGDDLGELLGHRIPADHSRQVLADHYAARLRARRVMDLGCGAGDSVDLFRSVDPGVSWVGVDIEDSPEVAGRTRADADFVTFDGRSLPFDGASFDLVYCKQVLEHVEHPRELLAEVARVLRPGGHLAGSTSQLEAFHSRSTLNWTPYGFTRFAEDAGLEIVELRPVIDGFTLVAWRALGLPRFFHRWWARESPPYRVIELAARAARLDARTRNQVKLVLAGQFAFLARPA
jgi:SAM-dependent methyltransferase